jgi:hypothetical protein
VANAEELEVMEMTHDQERRLRDLEKRLAALEDEQAPADDKKAKK